MFGDFNYVENIGASAQFVGDVLRPGGYWIFCYVQYLGLDGAIEDMLKIEGYASGGPGIIQWLTEYGSFEFVADTEMATAIRPIELSVGLILRRSDRPFKVRPLKRSPHVQKFEASGTPQREFLRLKDN